MSETEKVENSTTGSPGVSATIFVDASRSSGGLAAIWRHLQNWQSIYLFVPLSLVSIWVFAQGAYFLTGRRPTENVDWIVGISGNLVKLIFLIVFVEVYRQQMGVWLTRDQQIENPSLAWAQRLSASVALCVGAYILSR